MTIDASSIFQNADELEDNFTMLPNGLIRHPTLSLETIWLIGYLTSHSGNWIIQIKQLRDFLKGRLGRDALQKRVKEAEDAGYIQRVPYLYRGMSRVRFLVSKYPKFKKCLPVPENQVPDGQASIKNTINKKTIKEESKPAVKEEKRMSTPPPPPPAAASFSIEDEVKKSRLKKEDHELAIKYFKDNPDKFKKAKNPVGLLITLIDKGEHLKPPLISEEELNKQWAEQTINSYGFESEFSIGKNVLSILMINGNSPKFIKFTDENFRKTLLDRLELMRKVIMERKMRENDSNR